MVPGMIMLWYGAIVDIPSGWHLCDGTLNTPDLRGLFVAGAGGVLDPGDTGGASIHSHPFTGDGHIHTNIVGTPVADGIGYTRYTTLEPAVGDTDWVNHMPPYHALCYIMKLPIP